MRCALVVAPGARECEGCGLCALAKAAAGALGGVDWETCATLVMSAKDRTSSAFADVRGAVGMVWNGGSKVKQERSAKITAK